MKRLLGDDQKSEGIKAAIINRDISAAPLDEKEKLALIYARDLNLTPPKSSELMIGQLREAGYSDGEILEINQVVAYFAYANRTVIGLGCSTNGDIIGLSPNNSEDPSDWSHN
jgi:alkylhydroperoxidase family enzyme